LGALSEGDALAGLEERLAFGTPELTVLRDALARLLGPEARLVGCERLAALVRRLQFETGGSRRSLVVKRLDPVAAQRNLMLTERWLPAVALENLGPGLLASAADPDARSGWQVYRDWGGSGLDGHLEDGRRTRAAARAIAGLHLRFADHALLGECRLWGGDLGTGFYSSSARDALRALEALTPAVAELPDRTEAARHRLLEQLQRLLDEEGERGRAVEELGGPETLVHGDLWPKNIFVLDGSDGLRVRLIDWDRAGVARFPYDLSTLLIRLPAGQRPGVFAEYRDAVGSGGWRLPGDDVLNGLFDTAERARLASLVVWPALSLVRAETGRRAWALATLEDASGWFDALEPVLHCERSAVQ
jgi:hypothetical protein